MHRGIPFPSAAAPAPPRRPRARRFVHVSFLAATLALLPPAEAAAEPFALLAAARGAVTVTPAGGEAESRATFGRELARGDRISVPKGGSATVYFSDGNVIELGESSTLTLGGRAGSRPAVGPAATLPAGVYSNVARFVTRGSRESGLVAQSGLRSAEESRPLLLAPRRSDVREERPAFAWRAVEGATRYRVTLSGEEGELWTRESRATELAFPADAPALAGDRDYLWRVDALGEAGRIRSEESVFRVVPGEVRRSVENDLGQIERSAGGPGSPAGLFLAGSYLSGRGLYHEAAARFEALARSAPDSPAPHEALGNVFRAIGLMDHAAASYQKALELTRTP